MSDLKETGKGTKPAGQAAKGSGGKRPSKPRRGDLLDKVIKDFESKLEKGEVKLTVGDFVRLVQLRKDLHEEEPKEIRVTWVEPQEKEHADET
ncbi:MAG: hypothetical protein ACE141_06515 [Bryobacteraceae bacterium]